MTQPPSFVPMELLLDLCTLAAATLVALLLGIFYFFSKSSLGGRQRLPPIAGTVFHQLWSLDRLHDYHTELSSEHETFRIYAPFRRQFYTVDPSVVEHILKTNFHKYGKGWLSYSTTRDLFGDGIFAVDGEKWRQQRKLASYEFSTKVLRDYSSAIFKANAAKLAAVVCELSSAGQPMDIQDLLMKSTMDSIFKVGFGVDLRTLEGSSNERGAQFVKAFDDTSASIRTRFFDVFWKLKRFLNIGREASLMNNIKEIDGFVYDIIKAKVEQQEENSNKQRNEDRKEDILSRFLAESEKDPEQMSHRYLRDVILNFLIAGKDTTAGTLSWFLYLMCEHPSVQDKVAEEIREATGSCRAGPTDFGGFASQLTECAVEKLHYLHAALSETLRLYPAVPMDSKVCFVDDTLPGGFSVRKGDVVVYLPYPMGRMKSLWGEDASVFRPERWLSETGSFTPESPFKFTAFQAGPRICLGKDFAYRQMKIFAAVLLHFFEFKLKDENKPVRYRTMLTLHVDGGLHVCAVPR